MRACLNKICVFFLLLVILPEVRGNNAPNINITTAVTKIDDSSFNCELIINTAQGWKLTQAPEITLQNPKENIQLKYDSNVESLGDGQYRVNISFTGAPALLRGKLGLSIECFLCGKVCTIVSKNFSVSLTPENTTDYGFWMFVLSGFIGGLILNFMPCVLPVILMKLRMLKGASKVALFGSIAGNYATFGVLTAVLVALKISGEIVGWGLHFQNVFFLEVITIILFLLMLYSFEIITLFPSFEANVSSKGLFFGNFLSAVVSSIIAIPCTAPFLGTAAAFAIQGSLAEMVTVFFAIATGFTFPYFIALAVPEVKTFNLGRFSDIFKKIVNFGVAITFCWLFWLLTIRIEVWLVIVHLAFFIVLTLCFKKEWYKTAVAIIAAFGVLIGVVNITQNETKNDVLQQVQRAVESNQTVLFNISADWCLTCKYNKLNVLASKKVKAAIQKHNVVVIEGDLTRKNNELMHFIHEHNRVGIPFTIIYSRNAKDGIVLDEIPSAEDVVKAIERAKGPVEQNYDSIKRI